MRGIGWGVSQSVSASTSVVSVVPPLLRKRSAPLTEEPPALEEAEPLSRFPQRLPMSHITLQTLPSSPPPRAGPPGAACEPDDSVWRPAAVLCCHRPVHAALLLRYASSC